jgi:thiol-disulfide isomerase/thioredoxin
MKRIWLVLILTAVASAQNLSQAEQESLNQALAEAGNSSVDFIRALEDHLKRFPDSPKKLELQRALVKTAVDINDDRRIIQYGEDVLKHDPDNQQFLERVATALLRGGDKADAVPALEHARHLEQLIQTAYKNGKSAGGSGREEVKRLEEFDRGEARVRLILARAQGLLGHNEEAVKLSQASYSAYPSVEGARECARWLSASGKDKEAIQYLADAFTIAGLKSADSDGAQDRARLNELYRKLNGSETGLGDVILKAYDDTSAALAARRAQLRELDPNAQIKDPMHFTLSGPDGDKLNLASLLNKVVVLDFWATWCVPCREQHPLYAQVKSRFKDNGEVVFLSIATDEDRTLVKPFLESQKWSQKVYFEDGLTSLLQVSSIPTTVVFGKKGEVVSRMTGYLPDRFVDMLADRIDEALGKPRESQKPKGASSQ